MFASVFQTLGETEEIHIHQLSNFTTILYECQSKMDDKRKVNYKDLLA